jgi:hypothetical protein
MGDLGHACACDRRGCSPRQVRYEMALATGALYPRGRWMEREGRAILATPISVEWAN